jgi:hypothetical protein
MNKKSLSERAWIGIKKGVATPSLPEEMLEFQRKPIIRIIRVLGGISCLSIFGRGFFELHGIFLIIPLFFTFISFIYHIYISIHRFRHIKYLFKSGKLEVRNSPLDKFSSIFLKAIMCAKGSCDYATPVGLGLGLMLGSDEVLKATGREAFFTPFLGAGLDKVLPKTNLDQWRDSYIEAAKQINSSTNNDKVLSDYIKQAHELKDISDSDKKDYFKILSEMMDVNKEDLDKARSKIQDLIDNKPIK